MLFEVRWLAEILFLRLEHRFRARVSFCLSSARSIDCCHLSWLSKPFRLHFRGLFLYISSFQGRQLEPNRHEIDPNLVLALRR